MADTTADNSKETRFSTFENVLKVAAYPISVISGWLVADNYIRKGSYKNFARNGLFNDLQKVREQQYKDLLKDVPVGKHIDAAAAVQKIEAAYREQVGKRFGRMGLHELTGYWKTLHRIQKIDTYVMTATAAGISLGAMLTMAHEKDWVESLARRKQEATGHAETKEVDHKEKNWVKTAQEESPDATPSVGV